MLAADRALVTGGSRGIGRAVARGLKRAGAHVTILGRNGDTLGKVVKEGDADAFLVADVADTDAVKSAIATLAQPVGILVACAGIAESAPFQKSDGALFQRLFQVNVMGVVDTVQAVLAPMLAARRGRIVAIASTAALRGYPYVSAYCASKHAVLGIVRALAAETAGSGVTVNAVCPGFTDTEIVRESIARISARTGRTPDEALAELVKHNPQGRLITPEEVAGAVLWLCSAGAGAMTGQAIAVAGGEV